MKSPYQVYVFNFNQYSSLSCALEACKRVPEHEQTPVEFAAFETKEQQSKYIAGVQAVNNLPGPHHYAAVPLEYYLLKIYRGVDFDESYTAARADGAVYDTGVKVLIEELQNKELLGAYMRICDTSDHCIHNGQSNLQMLLVNPFEPTEFIRIGDLV